MAEQTVMVPANSAAAMLRQAAMLVGIAASVALGMWVVMWARTPNYSLLYSDLADRDVAEVIETLEALDIAHRVEHSNGAVLVASGRVDEARLKLASEGLPHSAGGGFELLDEDAAIGTSQFLEKARYQRALQGELARSIARLKHVRAARVHLALPKQSVFVRNQKQPSASVLVDLYPGRRLEEGQIAAIVHLVSSSVPELMMSRVTVVDQQGSLLTSSSENPALALSNKHFEYTMRLESTYKKRIEDILAPIVGHNGVKAEVTAEMDFTATEQTRESYNPDLPAMRSEQTLEEERSSNMLGGIPGALTNNPPADASAPEIAGNTERGQPVPVGAPKNMRRQATRNFELDKTISHTRMPIGSVRRLSVAVVVDNHRTADAKGVIESSPLGEDELKRITLLVKEAIGFNVTRGDTVNVINAEFTVPPPAQPLPEPPMWKEPWVWNVAKQLAGALFVLFVALGIIKPTLKNLMKREGPSGMQSQLLPQAAGAVAALPAGQGDGAGTLAAAVGDPAGASTLALPNNSDGGDVNSAQSFVSQEPKLAAQVVRNWVNDGA